MRYNSRSNSYSDTNWGCRRGCCLAERAHRAARKRGRRAGKHDVIEGLDDVVDAREQRAMDALLEHEFRERLATCGTNSP